MTNGGDLLSDVSLDEIALIVGDFWDLDEITLIVGKPGQNRAKSWVCFAFQSPSVSFLKAVTIVFPGQRKVVKIKPWETAPRHPR